MTAQYLVRDVRICSAGSTALRGAQTASTTSYSAASPGSFGRTAGKGEGSWGDSSSDPDSYFEPSSDSEPLELSVGDTDSGVVGVRAADVPDLAIADLEALTLSFFSIGPRAGFHGPAPFSGRCSVTVWICHDEGDLPSRSNFFTSAFDRRLLIRA